MSSETVSFSHHSVAVAERVRMQQVAMWVESAVHLLTRQHVHDILYVFFQSAFKQGIQSVSVHFNG